MTKYTLGFWQGAALYVGAVIGTGILVLPAIAAETAGPASVLAWLALVLLSFPLALTYAGLSRDRPDAAGFAGAIERAFGPRGGAAAGWIFLAQAPTGYVIAALIAGAYAASLSGGGREARVRPGPGIGDPAPSNGGAHLRAGRRDRGRHRRLRTVIRAGERVYSRYQSPDLCTRSPPAASGLARRRVGIGHPAARARRHGDVVRCRRGALVRRRVEHRRSAAAIHLVVHRDVRALDGGGYAPAGSAPKVRGCSLARRMRWRAVLRRGAARMDRRRRSVLSRVPVARDASAYGGAGTSAGCGWA